MVDLTGFRLTFDDEFNSLSVSATGRGTTWADTRSGSLIGPGVDLGFGQSAFVDPTTTGIQPFALVNGALRITAAPATGSAASLVAPSLWTSGLLQSSGSFSQTYGYFEMRAQLPAEPGTWPGFWMLASSGVWPPELDVVETFGADPTGLSNSVHTGQGGQSATTTNWTSQPDLASGYHTFGTLWTASTVTFYYDGRSVGQMATPADMHAPMYLVAALAMSRGVAGTTDTPKSMAIDYIRAFSADPSAVAVALQPVSSPDGVDTRNLSGATAATSGSGTASLTLEVSADLWNGGADFTVTVDGVAVPGTYEASTDHATGAWQDITLQGRYGTGPHQVAVSFINDASAPPTYDPATGWHINDRNLYVRSLSVGDHTYGVSAMTGNTASAGCDWLDPSAAVLVHNGTATFSI